MADYELTVRFPGPLSKALGVLWLERLGLGTFSDQDYGTIASYCVIVIRRRKSGLPPGTKAEDITSTVFARLLKSVVRIRKFAEPTCRTWLTRVTERIVVDAWRRWARDRIATAGRSLESVPERESTESQFTELLDVLREVSRESDPLGETLLQLRLAGYTFEEIEEITGVSRSSVNRIWQVIERRAIERRLLHALLQSS